MRPPITYALVPFLIGLITCKSDYNSFAVFFSCIHLIVYVYWLKKRLINTKEANRCLIAMLIGIIFVYICIPFKSTKPKDTESNSVISTVRMPPREMSMAVRIIKKTRINKKDDIKCIYYVGCVVDIPLIREDLLGKRISWFGKCNYINDDIMKEDTVNLVGVIRKTNEKDDQNKILYNLSHVNVIKIVNRNMLSKTRAIINRKIINKEKYNREANAFLYALLIGNKSYLNRQQKELFRETGTMHLFAVSGLHIGIVYLITSFILRRIIANNLLLVTCTIIVVFGYVLLVGSTPSACRAFIMITLWQSSCFFNKRKNSLSALLWTSALLMINDPEIILELSFQLSFTVVLCLVFSFYNVDVKDKKIKWLAFIQNYMLVSYSAFCGSALLLIDCFYYINPFSIVINSLLMFLVVPLFAMCFLYVLFALLLNIDIDQSTIVYVYNMLETVIKYCNQVTMFQYVFPESFDIPDSFHIFYPLLLILIIGYKQSLRTRIIYLGFIPLIILLGNLCLYYATK